MRGQRRREQSAYGPIGLALAETKDYNAQRTRNTPMLSPAHPWTPISTLLRNWLNTAVAGRRCRPQHQLELTGALPQQPKIELDVHALAGESREEVGFRFAEPL